MGASLEKYGRTLAIRPQKVRREFLPSVFLGKLSERRIFWGRIARVPGPYDSSRSASILLKALGLPEPLASFMH